MRKIKKLSMPEVIKCKRIDLVARNHEYDRSYL